MNGFDKNMFDEIERGERWLAQHSTIRPSAAAVEAVRQRVRDELAASSRRRMGWPAWIGAVAAAAMIVLAIGIGWKSQSSRSPVEQTARSNGSQQTTSESEAATIAMVNLESTLSELETLATDSQWDFEGRSLSDIYDEAFADSDGRDQKNGKSG